MRSWIFDGLRNEGFLFFEIGNDNDHSSTSTLSRLFGMLSLCCIFCQLLKLSPPSMIMCIFWTWCIFRNFFSFVQTLQCQERLQDGSILNKKAILNTKMSCTRTRKPFPEHCLTTAVGRINLNQADIGRLVRPGICLKKYGANKFLSFKPDHKAGCERVHNWTVKRKTEFD